MKKVFFAIVLILFMSVFFVGCPTPITEKGPEIVTVTFNPKNGRDCFVQQVYKGKTILEPTAPTREGWTFDCWTDKLGYAFDFDTKITSDITLTAKWEGVANFYDNQSAKPQTKTFIEGGSLYPGTCEDYEKDNKNYSFLYWSTNKDATEETRETDEFDFDADITVSPLNLYAVYTEKNAYTVTIDYNGLGEENKEVRVIEGDTANITNKPSASYYDFVYWYLENEVNPEDYKTPFDLNTPITEDITLKAKWTLKVDNDGSLYNGVYKVSNYDASEATEEELYGIKLTYSIGNETNPQNVLPITSFTKAEGYLYCYFDFINPNEKNTYYVTISNGKSEKSCSKVFYPFGHVSNLKVAEEGDTTVTLSFDKKEGYDYHTIRYYPTDKPEDIKESTNRKAGCQILGLSNNTEYTFEVYTQSNMHEEGVPVVLSEKVEIKGTPKVTKKQSDYLMIMYMDGDNDLNDPIYLDMNEVEYGLYKIRNSSSLPKTGYASVNVVALWDGWSGSYGDGNENPKIGSSRSYLYEIGTDYDNSTTYTDSRGCVLSSNTKDLTSKALWIEGNEVDMGNKQTLINFLNWVNEHYEAENVILQFSNHGGGPRSAPIYAKTKDGFSIKIDNSGRRALCWDESNSSLTGKSFLKTSDVSDALAAAGYGEDNKLDMILMDVCLGASVEDSYQFKDYANYLVASPNTVPGMGMDYVSIMKSFTSDSTIESIGEQLITDYKNYYTWEIDSWTQIIKELIKYYGLNEADLTEEVVTLLMKKSSFMSLYGIATLSMIDLTKIDELEDKITVLSELILNNKDKIFNGVTAQDGSSVFYIQFLRDYYVRYRGAECLSLAYQGTYSWLFDIGYMIDSFSFIAADIFNGQQNPDAWPELVAACSDVKTALEGAIVKAWHDYPYDEDLYEIFGGSHYGLVISGETIAIDGGNIVPGSCPDFYETDLAFGKDSAWTQLLKEWFGE